MTKEELDILKEKIVDELNWAMDSRKNSIDIMVDVDGPVYHCWTFGLVPSIC
mgnify:CR=1 FL=1